MKIVRKVDCVYSETDSIPVDITAMTCTFAIPEYWIPIITTKYSIRKQEKPNFVYLFACITLHSPHEIPSEHWLAFRGPISSGMNPIPLIYGQNSKRSILFIRNYALSYRYFHHHPAIAGGVIQSKYPYSTQFFHTYHAVDALQLSGRCNAVEPSPPKKRALVNAWQNKETGLAYMLPNYVAR
jgi:hypothetical protein